MPLVAEKKEAMLMCGASSGLSSRLASSAPWVFEDMVLTELH